MLIGRSSNCHASNAAPNSAAWPMQPEPETSLRVVARAPGSDQSLRFMPVVTRGSEGSCESGETHHSGVILSVRSTTGTTTPEPLHQRRRPSEKSRSLRGCQFVDCRIAANEPVGGSGRKTAALKKPSKKSTRFLRDIGAKPSRIRNRLDTGRECHQKVKRV
jgi:hypothetical protein